MTIPWWETIDTGERYVKDTDQSRWQPEPVKNGLIGWFEARRVTGVADGAPMPIIPDLTGAGHYLFLVHGITPQTWHANAGSPEWRDQLAGDGSYYGGAYPEVEGRFQDAVTMQWAGKLNVYGGFPHVWAWDFWPTYTAYGPYPWQRRTLTGEISDFTGNIGETIIPLGQYHTAGLAIDVRRASSTLIQNGVIIRNSGGLYWGSGALGSQFPEYYQRLGLSLAGSTPDGYWGWGDGNSGAATRGMLFYSHALTDAELLQNDAYLHTLLEPN